MFEILITNYKFPKTNYQRPIINYLSNRNREDPTVSIIIPSHNRSSLLWRGLDALHSQSYPLELISVIVVADSCIDDTLAMLQDYKAPFKQQVIEVNCRSAAIALACNTGAATATG